MPRDNETTTKFKVDISELKSAMQEAKKQVAYANSEFKATSSALDDWSKSSDGLNAKLKQLDSNLGSQKSVLTEYEKILNDVKVKYGENSNEAREWTTKVNNQQAVVNKTEAEIRKYQGTLESVTQAEKIASEKGISVSEALKQMARDAKEASKQVADVGNETDELSNSIDEASESAEKAEGGFTIFKGALASLVADGIKATIGALKDLVTESSEAFAQFRANTGIGVEAMDEYEKAIESVYKNNFGESLGDVAEKMAKVKEITGELDASKLQDMTEKAITLQDVFDMDMNETLRGVQSLMTHFGMSAEEAFDLMATGAQNGLNYTDELGDNVTEYAGKFAEAGYSADEYFQLLQNGSDGGAYNLDKVNDAINEVTARLADGTIGESIDSFSKDTQGLFKAWQDGEATQKEVIDSIVKDIQNTTGEQEKMNLSAKAFGTMAEDGGTKFIESISAVGSAYDDVTGKADELASIKYDTPTSALQGIGRTLKVELLQPLVDELMPYLNQFAEWVEANLPTIVAKVKELATKIKEIVDKIRELMPLLAGLGTAIVGLGIVALVGNFAKVVELFKAWSVVTKLQTAYQTALNVAMNMNPIGIIIALIAGLVVAFIALWNKSEAFRNFWIGLWDNVKAVVMTGVNAIVEFFTETIPNAFNAVVDWVKTNWQALLLFLINPFAGLFKYFYENNAKFKEFVDTAVNYIKELPSKIWTWLLNTINKVTTWRNNMINKAKDAGTNFINTIVSFFSQLPSKIWTWLLNTVSKVTEFGTNLVTKAKEIASKFVTTMVDGVKSLPDKFREVGGNIVKGIWEGISSGWDWLTDKVENLAQSLLKSAKKALGIHSPSRAFRDEVGKWIPAGIGVGVEKNAKTALNSVKNLAYDMLRATRNGLNTATVNGVTGGVAGGVVNNFTQVINSPKPLSRLEIYRQSKNLLGYAGGGV